MFVVWGVCRAGGVVPSTGVEVLGVEDTCESVIIGWLLMVLKGLSILAVFWDSVGDLILSCLEGRVSNVSRLDMILSMAHIGLNILISFFVLISGEVTLISLRILLVLISFPGKLIHPGVPSSSLIISLVITSGI